MDTITREDRSRLMAKIKSSNTQPEILVRKLLYNLGYRFRLHGEELPGKPDIILPKYKTTILVHGCFWHGHTCKHGHTPKSNQKYWAIKLKRNKERDKQNIRDLRLKGWRVLIIWECEINNIARLVNKLRSGLIVS